jgi:hypothetical protein
LWQALRFVFRELLLWILGPLAAVHPRDPRTGRKSVEEMARIRAARNLGPLPKIAWKPEGNGRYVGYGSNGYQYHARPSNRALGYIVTMTMVRGNHFYLGRYYTLE